eukprot:1156994-Pelagomonas_calceolata.AAC.2
MEKPSYWCTSLPGILPYTMYAYRDYARGFAEGGLPYNVCVLRHSMQDNGYWGTLRSETMLGGWRRGSAVLQPRLTAHRLTLD